MRISQDMVISTDGVGSFDTFVCLCSVLSVLCYLLISFDITLACKTLVREKDKNLSINGGYGMFYI
jgi:hypothetical protein